MRPLFVLPFSDEQEKTLAMVRTWRPSCVLLSSAAPVPESLVSAVYEKRSEAIAAAKGVCAPLVMGIWPDSKEAFAEALGAEPKNLSDWKRRALLLLAAAGNMAFVVDEKMSASQELITLLVVARIIKAKTLGVLPIGGAPIPLPNTVLTAADLVVSGEADGDVADALLRSLIGED